MRLAVIALGRYTMSQAPAFDQRLELHSIRPRPFDYTLHMKELS
jgi:hypothetical protein